MNLIFPSVFVFLLSFVSFPFTIKFAKKYGLVDDPTRRPHPAHVQIRIIPRAGGLGVYIPIVIASLIFLPIDKNLIGIVLGLTILLVMGLIDDKVSYFNPYLRLGLLFIAAGIAVFSGIGISFITNPFYNSFIFTAFRTSPVLHLDQIILTFNLLGPHKIILIADLMAFFWIVTLTQVINWAKGVDGQMPGITFVAALILGLFSLKLYHGGDPHQLDVAKLAFIVAAASLGMLVFNWHPAKILPAFSGSTILAYLLAILAILSGAKLATAMVTLAIPIVDFVYTFLRRIIQGKSPVWGDRGHLHHKLLDLGWSHQQISLFYILGSAMLGSVALLTNTESKLFTVLIVATLFLGFVLWINSFGELSKRHGPDNG